MQAALSLPENSKVVASTLEVHQSCVATQHTDSGNEQVNSLPTKATISMQELSLSFFSTPTPAKNIHSTNSFQPRADMAGSQDRSERGIPYGRGSRQCIEAATTQQYQTNQIDLNPDAVDGQSEVVNKTERKAYGRLDI